jgi:hypothetical protein
MRPLSSVTTGVFCGDNAAIITSLSARAPNKRRCTTRLSTAIVTHRAAISIPAAAVSQSDGRVCGMINNRQRASTPATPASNATIRSHQRRMTIWTSNMWLRTTETVIAARTRMKSPRNQIHGINGRPVIAAGSCPSP